MQAAKKEKAEIWKVVAEELSRPRKNRREVNLYEINKNTQKDETVVVPGKVLGVGNIDHKLTVAAFQFTHDAKKKIADCGSIAITISELMKKNPKGSKVRVLG